jgi:calcium-dependent protein kinase
MGACYSTGGEAMIASEHESPSPGPSLRKLPSLMPRRDVKEGGIGRAQFIIDRSGKILDSYAMDKRKLGEGSYGSVCRATHKATKAVRAIKTIPKAKLRNVDRVKREIAIMKMMDHPGIIKLYETFEDSRNIYLSMEICSGGELFERIVRDGRFSEPQAAAVMQQVLRAICYMHKQGVAHRDLKPENFLLQTQDPIVDNVVKIIDFGLSGKFEAGTPMKTRAGSPYYVAPEVLSSAYDNKCDLWSVGVILYIMLCGYPPFQGKNDAEVLQKVSSGFYEFRSQDWRYVSDDAKVLVTCLMKKSSADRFSAEQALRHVWIAHKAPKAPAVALQEGMVSKLREFRLRSKFMKASLHVIASQLDETQIRGLRDIFVKLDANGDGLITHSELRRGLQQASIQIPRPEVEEIMDSVDCDGSGEIDYTEFLAATIEKQQYIQEDVCWNAFNLFDLNCDGKITSSELKQMLDKTSTRSADELVREVDANNDGSVDFQEFMKMMRGSKVLPGNAP